MLFEDDWLQVKLTTRTTDCEFKKCCVVEWLESDSSFKSRFSGQCCSPRERRTREFTFQARTNNVYRKICLFFLVELWTRQLFLRLVFFLYFQLRNLNMFSNSGGRHQLIKIGLRQRNIYMCRRLRYSFYVVSYT